MKIENSKYTLLRSVYKHRLCLLWTALIVSLLFVSLVHVSSGAKSIAWKDIYDAFFHFDSNKYIHHIIIKQRLSRLIVAAACGAMLGVSGFACQKLLQNPLVSSSTLGVISGANFFCIAGIFFLNVKEDQLFVPAMLGAIAAGVFTLTLTVLMNKSNVLQGLHIVFAGALVSILFGSLSTFILSLDPLRFSGLQAWLLGDIGTSDYKSLKIIYPLSLFGIILLISQTRAMDPMMMGDKKALSVGVNVRRVKILVILAIFILSSSVVAVVGPIGFVGLVAPHMVKLFVNEIGYKGMLLSIFIGSMLLVVSDLLARTLFAPKILLVGAVTSSFGGLAFLILLLVKGHRLQN